MKFSIMEEIFVNEPMNNTLKKTHKQKASEKRAGVQDGLLDSLNEFDKIKDYEKEWESNNQKWKD